MASSRPSYEKQRPPVVVSAGKVSRPKPFRPSKFRAQQPPTKIVKAHGRG